MLTQEEPIIFELKKDLFVKDTVEAIIDYVENNLKLDVSVKEIAIDIANELLKKFYYEKEV